VGHVTHIGRPRLLVTAVLVAGRPADGPPPPDVPVVICCRGLARTVVPRLTGSFAGRVGLFMETAAESVMSGAQADLSVVRAQMLAVLERLEMLTDLL